MEQEIIKHMNTIMEWVKSGGAFVAKEAPDVAVQLIKYNTYTSILNIIVFLIGALIMIRPLNWSLKKIKEIHAQPYVDHPGYHFCFAGICGLIVFCCMGATTYSEKLIKLTVAPKVFLLETLSGLVK